MEWVIVAVVVVALLVTIGISTRQRSAVRAQQDQLRRLEAKLDALGGGQQPPPGEQRPPYPQSEPYPQSQPYPTAQPPGPGGGYPGSSYPAGYGDPGLDPRMDEIRRLVREGRRIEAIKVYREMTGAGLKEAKDAVERMTV